MSYRSLPLAVSGLLLLIGGGSACSAPSSGEADPGPIGQSAQAITGAQMVSLGQQWVAADLHYCQAAYGAVDYDSSCWAWEGPSHICDRESNAAWNAYRSDCSGFITWSWGLPPVGDGGYVTSDFAPFDTSFSTVIQAIDMQPGDAANLTAGGHIVLFVKWTTPGSEAVFMEEPGCSADPPYAHQFTSSVTVSGSSIDIDYEGDSFTAIRYNGITAAPPSSSGTGGSGEGAGGSGGGTAGSAASGSSTGGSSAAGSNSGGSSGTGGAGAGAGASASNDRSSTCAYRAPGADDAGAAWLSVAGVAMIVNRRRRRRA